MTQTMPPSDATRKGQATAVSERRSLLPGRSLALAGLVALAMIPVLVARQPLRQARLSRP